MKTFTVKWEIEVSADSKEEAAIQAQRIMQDEQVKETTFSIVEFDNTEDEFEEITLME